MRSELLRPGLLRSSPNPAGHSLYRDPHASSVRCRVNVHLRSWRLIWSGYPDFRLDPSSGFVPELQGFSLVIPVPERTHNLAVACSFQPWPSCCFAQLQGFSVIAESVVSCETRSPRVLCRLQGLALDLHRFTVTSTCRSCLLIKASAGCSASFVCSKPSCDGSKPLPSWAFPSRDFPRDTVFCCFQQIPRSVLTAGGLYPAPRSASTVLRFATGSYRRPSWAFGREFHPDPLLRFFASTEVRLFII